MNEQAILVFIQQTLEEHYDQSDCALYSLNTRTLDDGCIVYKMYRIDRGDYPSWVISAAHDDLVSSHTFGWEWEPQGTALAWLEMRAKLLLALTHQGYPVPHVVFTLSGACVVRAGAWSVFVTTWVVGQSSLFQPGALSQAGALLARLHMLPLEAMPPLQPARWNSRYSIPHALLALEEVRVSIPSSHQPFYQACYTALQAMLSALSILPEALIHTDCWMQNVVVTEASTVFIDWESAGRGAAILDLADFLLRSQCDANGAPPHTLRPPHVTAAASGYASHRTPGNNELDLLALAMHFSCAWRAAWMFTQLRSGGWTSKLEQGLARSQATYEIAEQTTCLALSVFR
jgi:Ser/Thr protein kinase RdoA (MazF antagonist)